MILTASGLGFTLSLLLLPLLKLENALAAGTEFAALAAMVAATSGAVTGIMALWLGRRIERLERSNHYFERLSRVDSLSGLLNRRAFEDVLAKAPQGSSLVILDVDRFKSVNDTHGHAKGDEVIRRVGQLIVEMTGDAALGARLGGEEFGFLLASGDLESRVSQVDALRARIENERFESEFGPFGVTVSAGLSETVPGRETGLVYAAADKALYLAKASGRNRVVHGSDGLSVILEMIGGTNAGTPAGGRGAA